MIDHVNKEWFEVFDAETGELLSSGQVKGYKSNNPSHKNLVLISFDGKWYFNVRSPKFIVNKKEEGRPYIPFDESKLPRYTWKKWQDHSGDVPDLYREHGYDEIDPEVRPLVDELNMWEGIETVGSCCGHGKGNLWIQINVTDLTSLNTILNILRSPEVFPKMVGRFNLSIDPANESTLLFYNYNEKKEDTGETVFMQSTRPHQGIISYYNEPILYIVLMSKAIGEQAYIDAELFRRYLIEVRSMVEETKRVN